jgi:hypothetical protein
VRPFIQKKQKNVVIVVKKSLQQSFIQIEQKRGVIGAKCSLQKSIIQKNCKMRDYRGKMQFTAINHSKKAQNTG